MNVDSITSAAERPLREASPVLSFDAAALRRAAPAQQRKAVAGQFEAILVRQLLGKTLTGMLGSEGGAAGGIYGDLLADTLSQQLTAGRGLGIGQMIQQQITPAVAGRASAAGQD